MPNILVNNMDQFTVTQPMDTRRTLINAALAHAIHLQEENFALKKLPTSVAITMMETETSGLVLNNMVLTR